MNTTDYIGIANVVAQLIVAGVAIWAVLASLNANKRQIEASDLQIRQQIEENRRLATEERQHQSRPVLVPVGGIYPTEIGRDIHITGGGLNWNYQGTISIMLHNMGGGAALNIHCVLYGPETIYAYQFVSWNNEPIDKVPVQVNCDHPQRLHLNPDDSIDGKHPLFDISLDSPSNPIEYRIACLTMTYHDLFDNKHFSIFNYTIERRWVPVAMGKIPEVKGKAPLDLKELDDQKKQQGIKLSAPPPITSP